MSLEHEQLLRDCRAWMQSDISDVESQINKLPKAQRASAVASTASYLEDSRNLVERLNAVIPEDFHA